MQYMSSVLLTLPDWLDLRLAAQRPLVTSTARMMWVLDLLEQGLSEGCGPFAAAVFERDSGRPVAVGINRVMQSGLAMAHAELMALTFAQARLGLHDLGAPNLPAHTLVSSSAPCLMCLGAVLWSGVRELVCGAAVEDALAIGFDEGPLPPDWPQQLARRGIVVQQDVVRPRAVALLQAYAAKGGPIYNGRQSVAHEEGWS